MADETTRKTHLPKKYHDAVLKWRDTFIPDYGFLMDQWDNYFPNKPRFELCAYYDCSVCPNVEVGMHQGREKFTSARQMNQEQADHLLKAVKAQASTELGSIQQHRLTLARAEQEQDQVWILRMMAEELRHGYQMFSVLLEDDWKSVATTSGEDMVEEVLSMRTGSHVLGAFNIDFDSFLDNSTFCAVIDRVGKYQLEMQKVSAYRPMSESMPPMLREEAFHMATGVAPLRRWAEQAGKGEGTVSMDMMQRAIDKWFPRALDMFGDERGGGRNVKFGFKPMKNGEGTVSMDMMQRAIDKWFPRALDMFGDERGGGRNVKFGFKPMKNGEAMERYVEEMQGVVDDVNERYLRARFPDLDRTGAREALQKLKDGDAYEGVRPEEMITLPHVRYFRRRGPHAFLMVDRDGRDVADFATFKTHMAATQPDAYLVNRDYVDYLEKTRQVAAGELEQGDAVRTMPQLSRVGGSCPCSNAVRWVMPEGAEDAAAAGTANGTGARAN